MLTFWLALLANTLERFQSKKKGEMRRRRDYLLRNSAVVIASACQVRVVVVVAKRTESRGDPRVVQLPAAEPQKLPPIHVRTCVFVQSKHFSQKKLNDNFYNQQFFLAFFFGAKK
jgi:hypothetical protein